MKDRWTFAARMGVSTGILGLAVVLLAGLGYRELGIMDKVLRQTVEVNARKDELMGKLDAAKSDMAVSQRGVILFTYAKNPAAVSEADALFQEASQRCQRALADVRPLLVTDRGKQLTTQIEAGVSAWLPAYADVRRLASGGD